jgi:hypothetical protein
MVFGVGTAPIKVTLPEILALPNAPSAGATAVAAGVDDAADADGVVGVGVSSLLPQPMQPQATIVDTKLIRSKNPSSSINHPSMVWKRPFHQNTPNPTVNFLVYQQLEAS